MPHGLRCMPRISKEAALLELGNYRAKLALTDTDCLLCAMLSRDTGDVIAQTRHAVARLNRFGCSFGHVSVVMRRHVECVTDLSWPEYVDAQRLVFEVAAAVRRHCQPQRLFVAALGAAEALVNSYPHYHVHIVPVYHADERGRPAHVLSWSSGVTTYADAEAGSVVRSLSREFSLSTQAGLDASSEQLWPTGE
jgi:diadenosine tetraphosphate (Ap4A) HIT family hydrolase